MCEKVTGFVLLNSRKSQEKDDAQKVLFHGHGLKKGVVVSSATVKRTGVRSNSNSGWNVQQVRESDTAVLRYNRVAMLEAVLSIRDRQHRFVRRLSVIALMIAGGLLIAVGILGCF